MQPQPFYPLTIAVSLHVNAWTLYWERIARQRRYRVRVQSHERLVASTLIPLAVIFLGTSRTGRGVSARATRNAGEIIEIGNFSKWPMI